jgi:broad specificity phosphatase PhoE
MSRIILTRHGQTEWNRIERFRGRADIALNNTGLIQAEITSKSIQSRWNPVAVYTSPMSRAVKTGEIIAAPLGLIVQPMQKLNDIDYGQWQGLTPDEVRNRWGTDLEAWYRVPHLAHIPGGESLQEVLARTTQALGDIVGAHPSGDVVVVGHDSVNRVLLLFMLGLPLSRYWRLSQGTCAINVIDFVDNDFSIVTLNELGHLTPP